MRELAFSTLTGTFNGIGYSANGLFCPEALENMGLDGEIAHRPKVLTDRFIPIDEVGEIHFSSFILADDEEEMEFEDEFEDHKSIELDEYALMAIAHGIDSPPITKKVTPDTSKRDSLRYLLNEARKEILIASLMAPKWTLAMLPVPPSYVDPVDPTDLRTYADYGKWDNELDELWNSEESPYVLKELSRMSPKSFKKEFGCTEFYSTEPDPEQVYYRPKVRDTLRRWIHFHDEMSRNEDEPPHKRSPRMTPRAFEMVRATRRRANRNNVTLVTRSVCT